MGNYMGKMVKGGWSSEEYGGDTSSIAGIVSDLDRLSENSAGKVEIIDFFSQEGNNVTIKMVPSNDGYTDEYKSNSGLIFVQQKEITLPTTEGDQVAPNYIVLGHEMAHRKSDVQKKEGRYDAWYKKMNGKFTAIDEIQASHIENKIRKAAGLPLRNFYGGNRTSQSKLLTNDGKKSLYIDKNENYPTKNQISENNYEY